VEKVLDPVKTLGQQFSQSDRTSQIFECSATYKTSRKFKITKLPALKMMKWLVSAKGKLFSSAIKITKLYVFHIYNFLPKSFETYT